MKANNPLLIPRNHIVEESLINVCENNDYNNFNELVNLVKKPYANNKIKKYYQSLPNYFKKPNILLPDLHHLNL